MATINLERPEGANAQWHAVMIIGRSEEGPWHTSVSPNPLGELLVERKSVPDSIVAALRWCATPAIAKSVVNQIEGHIAPVRRSQKAPHPLVFMSKEMIVAILNDAAVSCGVPAIAEV